MSVDWDQLRQGLRQLRRALDEDDGLPAQDTVRQELASRARNLAQAREAPPPEDARQVLDVTLGGLSCAFEMKYLAEVLPFTPLAPVPGTPAFVMGMVLARGRVVSCIDLPSFLGLPVTQLAEPTGIVVLAHDDMEIGVPVQQVGSIESVPASLMSVQGQLSDHAQSMLLGVTPAGAFVLDSQRLLADPKLPIIG